MATERLCLVMAVSEPMRTTLGDRIDRIAGVDTRIELRLVDGQAEFERALVDANAAIVWPDTHRIPDDALDPARPLRWIQSIPAGVNHLLTPALVAADHVVVTSSKGPMAPSMAEHVVGLMLALSRRLNEYGRDQVKHEWNRRRAVELMGKTILILGVGQVGGTVARICREGLRMRVLGMARRNRENPYVDRYVDRADLHAALGEADVVALTMPQTADTRQMIDAAALAAMKPTAFLINVARGTLVDEAALIEALRADQIAGAGLEAVTVEPLPPDSPLWDMPNVIITPHASAQSDRFADHMVEFWCENVRRFIAGESLRGVVDKRAGY